MRSITNRLAFRYVLLAAAVCLLDLFPVSARADDDEPQLVTRIYQLSDLILPTPDHTYSSEVPTTDSPKSRKVSTGFGGGFGGGVGGGGLGGGGFFQIAPNQPNTAAGQVPTPIPPVSESPTLTPTRFSILDLAETIMATVKPESWEDVGGPASLRPLGTMLIVMQTAEAHKEISDLLDNIRSEGGTLDSVTVEAIWLLLDSDELDGLRPDSKQPREIDRDILGQLTRAETSYRGQITCFSGQNVFIVAGKRRSMITSVIPVVGSEVGYQPVSSIPNLGVLLQLQPTLVPQRQAAIVNLVSTVTESKDADETFRMKTNPGSAGTSPIDKALGKQRNQTEWSSGSTTSLELDRVNLAAQQLATTVLVPLGRPVLVGGLTLIHTDNSVVQELPAAPNPTGAAQAGLAKKLESKGERRQLYLIVEVNVNRPTEKKP